MGEEGREKGERGGGREGKRKKDGERRGGRGGNMINTLIEEPFCSWMIITTTSPRHDLAYSNTLFQSLYILPLSLHQFSHDVPAWVPKRVCHSDIQS